MKIAIAGRKEKTINYKNAIELSGGETEVTLDLKTASKCHALLLPGGGDINPGYWGEDIRGSNPPDDELDKKQMEILDYYVRMKKPVFGICRGMQLINVYFKGSIIQDLSGKDMHIQKNERDQIHLAIAKEGSLMHTIYGERFFINSAHHQGIKNLGENIISTSSAEDGVIESIEHKNLPVWGVQFHPERLCFAFHREDAVDGSLLLNYFLQQME